MKILVVGGAGYIGSVCAELLLDEGHDVVIFDNLSEGHRAAIDSRAEFVEGLSVIEAHRRPGNSRFLVSGRDRVDLPIRGAPDVPVTIVRTGPKDWRDGGNLQVH